MTRLVFGHDAAVADWVAARIPHVDSGREFGPLAAIGVATGDRLVAGVVYHKFHPAYGFIEISMAASSPIWARWPTIIELLRYPFVQLGVNVVQTIMPHTNKAALSVNRHIGFKQEAVLRHRFGRDHAVVMSMLRREFDKLVKEHDIGRKIREDARAA